MLFCLDALDTLLCRDDGLEFYLCLLPCMESSGLVGVVPGASVALHCGIWVGCERYDWVGGLLVVEWLVCGFAEVVIVGRGG